jgi:hypothetical protein
MADAPSTDRFSVTRRTAVDTYDPDFTEDDDDGIEDMPPIQPLQPIPYDARTTGQVREDDALDQRDYWQ